MQDLVVFKKIAFISMFWHRNRDRVDPFPCSTSFWEYIILSLEPGYRASTVEPFRGSTPWPPPPLLAQVSPAQWATQGRREIRELVGCHQSLPAPQISPRKEDIDEFRLGAVDKELWWVCKVICKSPGKIGDHIFQLTERYNPLPSRLSVVAEFEPVNLGVWTYYCLLLIVT